MVMVFDKMIVVAKAPEQVTVRKNLRRERNTAPGVGGDVDAWDIPL